MKNIIEKIWNFHVVERKKGYPDVLMIDLHLLHEVTSPQAFKVLKDKNLPYYACRKTFATIDHNVPTIPLVQPHSSSQIQIQTLKDNCRQSNIPLLDQGSGYQGIVHVIGPELGFTQPAATIVCGDSHTSTHGAFGALAFGIGTTEIALVMATGCLLQYQPKTMRVTFKGRLSQGVTAKDMVLALIKKIGTNGAAGHIIEYAGEINVLTLEERMTICNMSIECGARAGLMAPDEVTFNYLKGKIGAPKEEKWNQAVAFWRSFQSDEGALFDQEVELDLTSLSPMLTWGITPEQAISIEQPIPEPSSFPVEKRDLIQRALDYVRLKPGKSIEGVPVDYVFIGSCTNARYSDLYAAAQVMKGKKVPPSVKVLIVPGSEAVQKQAIKEGLAAIFEEAGAEFRTPGCSMCLAMNGDLVPPGKRCASTSNRNFIGRQGPGSITHLMSPMMAAAAAVTGTITDVRKII